LARQPQGASLSLKFGVLDASSNRRHSWCIPTATRAYAWSSPIAGSDKRRFYAVLHVPPVNSAADAMRAAIVADYRNKAGNGRTR
jgi:hypothetical protein